MSLEIQGEKVGVPGRSQQNPYHGMSDDIWLKCHQLPDRNKNPEFGQNP